MRHFFLIISIITFFASLLAIPFAAAEDFEAIAAVAIIVLLVVPASLFASGVAIYLLAKRKAYSSKKRGLVKVLLGMYAFNGLGVWILGPMVSLETQLFFLIPLMTMVVAAVAFVVIVSKWNALE